MFEYKVYNNDNVLKVCNDKWW